MRFIWISVFVLGVATIVISGQGCGSSSTDTPVMCGNSDVCQANDPICVRGCGRGQTMSCQCGTGPLGGTLVCGPCSDATAGTGGRGSGGDVGGTGGTAGRAGRGTGGATAMGGRMGRGGRNGRGMAGANGAGGVQGTGGATPTDGGIAACPANAQAGGASCMANATPICQTACVGSMFNICTCLGGEWNCPANQLPCQ